MKHNWLTTVTMLVLFLCAQVIGLSIINTYLQDESLFLVAPPEVENESLSFIPIVIAILVGTCIVLLMAKFHLRRIWKIWFGASIFIALSFALYPFFVSFFPLTNLLLTLFALVILGLTLLKIHWHYPLYQNVAELFVYGGIISLFSPIINIVSASVLLLLISIYDMYAVWKSKHMITLAKFQTDAKVFAGLMLPGSGKPSKKKGGGPAILGGGDIAFPLLFSAALLKLPQVSLGLAFVSSLGALVGLAGLLIWSKQGRFYPAMPFISAGSFLGGVLVWFLTI